MILQILYKELRIKDKYFTQTSFSIYISAQFQISISLYNYLVKIPLYVPGTWLTMSGIIRVDKDIWLIASDSACPNKQQRGYSPRFCCSQLLQIDVLFECATHHTSAPPFHLHVDLQALAIHCTIRAKNVSITTIIFICIFTQEFSVYNTIFQVTFDIKAYD